jgi:hypothetical protein
LPARLAFFVATQVARAGAESAAALVPSTDFDVSVAARCKHVNPLVPDAFGARGRSRRANAVSGTAAVSSGFTSRAGADSLSRSALCSKPEFRLLRRVQTMLLGATGDTLVTLTRGRDGADGDLFD